MVNCVHDHCTEIVKNHHLVIDLGERLAERVQHAQEALRHRQFEDVTRLKRQTHQRRQIFRNNKTVRFIKTESNQNMQVIREGSLSEMTSMS